MARPPERARYIHPRPDTAEESALRELYKEVPAHSHSPVAKRPQSPTAINSTICCFWKQGTCHHGSSCKCAHTISVAPAPQTASDTEGKPAGQKR